MFSPGLDTPSLREIRHGSRRTAVNQTETESIPETEKALTPTKHGVPEAQTRAPDHHTETQSPDTAPARGGISVERLTFSPSIAPEDEQLQLELMDAPELAAYLELQGCTEDTIQEVVNAGFTGTHWVGLFSMDECDSILKDDLKIDNRLTSVKLTTHALRQLQLSKAEQAKTPTTTYSTRPNNDRVRLPELPKPDRDGTHLSFVQWRDYQKAIEGWIQLGDPEMATMASSLFSDPSQNLETEIADSLSATQRRIDSMLAVNLLESTYVSAQCKDQNKYKLNGYYSGLQIIATLGRLINKKTGDKQIKALDIILEQKPVEDPTALHKALGQMHDNFSLMEQQGSAVGNDLKFTLLMKLVKPLLERPDMILHLTTHIAQVQIHYPNNAERLLTI